ncbi:MAG: MerR family transcriptional regulator [Halieaceae bacterium]|nr:MerR family transcriptional regulator [Halieaceae bacterium]
MLKVQLEPRPLYAIGTIARLTGLKPDTLRIWERRYGLGASHRSETGRRQYTQTDLEHLQLVATLVNSGVRIGEISACDRKTLEIMLQREGGAGASTPVGKPLVLFLGEGLCAWLDDHQGCLSHVNASLARVPLAEARAALPGDLASPDLLVVGCETLGATQARQVDEIATALGARRTLVIYHDGNERTLQLLQERGVSTGAFPPDPGFLAFEFSRSAVETVTRAGTLDLGELVANRPRQISPDELAAACSSRARPDRFRAAQLADLVAGLARLEADLAEGEVRNWSEAATRACAYAYAGQARWLMERALQAVLADPTGHTREPGEELTPGRLHDAA